MGDATNPLSLHKYMYASGNPVNCLDPLGMFTSHEGMVVEKEIFDVYVKDHSGNTVINGRWTRFDVLNLFRLKPDILNKSTSKWLDVKPFSPSGLIDGANTIFKYAPLMLKGYSADAGWNPSVHKVFGEGKAYWFVNTGAIVFYTDAQDNIEDFLLITTMAMARQLLPQIIGQMTMMIGALVGARAGADLGRLEGQVGIACMLGMIGGFAI